MARSAICIAAFAAICMSSGVAALAADVDFTGTWKSDKYGTCTMIQNADRVNGRMVYPNGSKGDLDGAITNRTLKYEWGHETDRGTGELILSLDGSTLTGYWKSSTTGDKDDWVLKKVQ